ncbi:hypothetical protein ACT3S8_06370 [Halomonas sp. AOP42-D2-25]|uniref:hypothetical protein n=1 Tax=Halomonas sp. AOP42-D2-25 TaxID=3457666 RepID=UPI004034AC92
MSTYLFAACSPRRAKDVESFFLKNKSAEPGQQFHSGYVFGCGLPFAKGHLIDHENRRIVYFNEGDERARKLIDPRASYEGCFISAIPEGEALLVKSDFWGQLPKFYFSQSGVSACSDSLLLLSELRKHLGLPCAPDEEVLLAKSWLGKTNLGEQIFSEKTILANVYYCPAASDIEIRFVNGCPYVSIKRFDYNSIVPDCSDCYPEVMRKAVEKIINLSTTYMSVPEADNLLWLSGGMDSRIVLASFLYGNSGRFRAKTNSLSSPDGVVANSLSKNHGFTLNRGFPRSHLVKEEDAEKVSPLKAWMSFSAGCYDPLHLADATIKTSPAPRPVHFHFTGHGAGTYKGAYDFESLPKVIERSNSILNSEAKSVFIEECCLGLENVGFGREMDSGAEWHYLIYRNALHSGRSITTNLIAPRILFSKELTGLSKLVGKNLTVGPSFVSFAADLLILLNPTIAAEPFAEKFKNMSSSVIDDRRKFLGSLSKDERFTPEPYSVIGSPSMVNPPFSQLANSVVEKKYGIDISLDECKDIALSGYDKLPEWLRDSYDPLVRRIGAYQAPKLARGGEDSVCFGRMMSFSLFD